MPDYFDWNRALIEYFTAGAPDGSTIYLDVTPRQEPLLPMPAGDAPTLAPAPLLPQAGAWSAGVDRMHRICRMSTLHVMA